MPRGDSVARAPRAASHPYAKMSSGMSRRSATPGDRAHFAAIAAAEKAAEDDRFARAAERPPGEGMLAGIRLGAMLPMTRTLLAEIDARADGQMELARRRVALGIGTKARA